MHSGAHDRASRDFLRCGVPLLFATRAHRSDEGFCRRLAGLRPGPGSHGPQRDVWAIGQEGCVSVLRTGRVEVRRGICTLSHSTLSQLRSGPMMMVVLLAVWSGGGRGGCRGGQGQSEKVAWAL